VAVARVPEHGVGRPLPLRLQVRVRVWVRVWVRVRVRVRVRAGLFLFGYRPYAAHASPHPPP